jgi:virginiamycin A acetyltransferase
VKYSSHIIINEDCFIGINVFIKSGIAIVRGSVIHANSNILQNIEPYSVISGNPARLIKKD